MADEEEAAVIGEQAEEDSELSLHSAGETLRLARKQKNLSIEDVAKTTRVPQRHLDSIEAGDFAALPGRTYAIGFAKSYARAVGLNEAAIGSQVREEMEEQGHAEYQPETSGYAPANPTSIPPVYLAWTSAGIAVVLLVGFLIWRTLILEPADLGGEPVVAELNEDGASAETPATTPVQEAATALSSSGTVVLTAKEEVWLKIYDADGERLFENQMAAGDQYTVPGDANDPQILTGRPDALTVAIDGKTVPALGTAERTIKDVGVSAAALLARDNENETGSNSQNN